MKRLPVPAALVALALLLACGPASANDVHLERDGIVVIDVESVPATGGWQRSTSIGGYKGEAYLVWRGANLFAASRAGRDTLRYRFRISTPGDYQLRWRSRIAEGRDSTESNDSWVRFPTGRDVPGEQPLNGWTKGYMNTRGRWSWDTFTVDFRNRPIRQRFGAGDHVIEISGRSRGHALDRLALYRYASVPYSVDRFERLALSPTAGGDRASPSPEPRPEPAPAEPTAPTPSPAAPAVAPAPAARPDGGAPRDLRATVYSATTLELFWSRPDEIGVSYDVSVDGRPLDTTDGTSYFLDGLSAGTSYTLSVSATDASGTASDPASVTVTTAGAGTPVTIGPPAPAELVGTRYSDTAAELFWDRAAPSANVVSTEVFRDGSYLGATPGNSFHDADRVPGTTHAYGVIAVDASGRRSAAAELLR